MLPAIIRPMEIQAEKTTQNDSTFEAQQMEIAPAPAGESSGGSPDTAPDGAGTSPDASDSASLVEKIRGAASPIFERAGVVFKRGRGRPRSDGQPKINDVPQNVPPGAVPVNAAAPLPDSLPGVDTALVKRCCSAIAKAVQGFLDRKLYRAAKTATGDPKLAREICTEAAITREETEAFSELAAICLRKYGVGSEYMPEVGLAAIAAGVGLRYVQAMETLATYSGAPKNESSNPV